MQFTKAVDLFLSGYFSTCQRSPRTIQAYTIDLEQFGTFIGDELALGEIKPPLLEDWAAELKEAGYASASIRRKFASLKVLFNYWIRREVIDRSPLWKMRIDLDPERRLPPTLTLEEVQRLLAHARNLSGAAGSPQSDYRAFLALRNLAIVELLFATGIRIGELSRLSLNDYRPDESAFLIRGKGARQRLAILPDPRTRGVFEVYIAARKSHQDGHGVLFVNHYLRPLSTQGAASVVTSLAQECGITRRVTPHMLRHTIATLLLRRGADIRVVQEFLGHATISTTQKYTHVSKSQLRRALDAFHPNN